MFEKVKVLHVFGSLNRGGAESMIMNIYSVIDKNKLQFDFIKHTNYQCAFEKEIESLGGVIFTFPKYKVFNHFEYVSKWTKFLKDNNYDIIHGHMVSTAFIYLRIAKRFHVTTIAHSHSSRPKGNFCERAIKIVLQKKVKNLADYLFACSETSFKALFGNAGFKRDTSYIIRNAIDTNKFSFDESIRDSIRTSLNLKNRFVIGHVGNFTLSKNHEYLLDIFSDLKTNDNLSLVLIGDGILRNKILKQIKRLGLNDKVVLLGSISDVQNYLFAMDLFVFPSKFEGFGISLIEAQATGLRCLVSDSLPSEVLLTDLIKCVSLKCKKRAWTSLIERMLVDHLSYDRKKYASIILQKGYDIFFNSTKLENLYLSMKGAKH